MTFKILNEWRPVAQMPTRFVEFPTCRAELDNQPRVLLWCDAKADYKSHTHAIT